MATLSTGHVILGVYADKLRRTLFAQLSDKLRSKELDPKEIARAAAEINQRLFELLVNQLKLDKGDVVRIRIDYDLENRSIIWKYDTLRIEAFRKVPDEEISKIIEEKSAST